MLATSPSSHPSQATRLRFSPTKGKAYQNSATSTRTSSPISSSSSDDGGDSGALARRRGRNVLMLNELVTDLEPCRGSPTSDSSGMSSENTTRYTASVPQVMSFVQPIAGGSGVTQVSIQAGTNQVADQNMMRTSPASTSGDASQRIPACTSRLGAAAAGGDASQRQPVGRVSLGVAHIGGDASQRSPPGGERGFGSTRPRTVIAQPHAIPNPVADLASPLRHCGDQCWSVSNGILRGITGTSPAVSSPDSSTSIRYDASQRSPTKAFDASRETIKSWLSGTNGFLVSDIDLAERLHAAAPESYED